MATSTGKTIGLVLLIALIVLISLRLTPLILAPLGVFTGAYHVLKVPSGNLIGFATGIPRIVPTTFLSLVLFAIWVVIIIWVYRDAERRGMNGVLWALLVLIGNLIGLLIYLIVRSDAFQAPPGREPSTRTCPNCQRSVASSFAYCPNCGSPLQPACPECKQQVETGWKACPHCGTKLEEKKLTEK